MNEYFMPFMSFLCASIWLAPTLNTFYRGRINIVFGIAWACVATFILIGLK